jgi:predicted RNA-binding Zn ribbon-like protein
VTENLVDLHLLALEEDVQPDAQRADRGEEMRAHEVGKREAAVGRAHKERAAFLHVRDVLARHVVVGQQPAAVRVARQRQLVERLVELRLAHRHAERAGDFLEKVDPGVEVGGAVVAMHHRHRLAGGRRHHVDFGVKLR